MNVEVQQVEAMVEEWLEQMPSPAVDDRTWDKLASRIDERIENTTLGRGDDDWFAAPLPSEAGEPTEASESSPLAGERKMSDPSPNRPSLKELAERVSKAPAPRTPMESESGSGPASGARGPSSPNISSPAISTPPKESWDDDSGLVDLAAVQKKEQEEAAAEKAAAEKAAAEKAAAEKKKDEAATSKAKSAESNKSSSMPYVGGGVVGLLAIAAAVVLVMKSPGSSVPTVSDQMNQAARVQADQGKSVEEKDESTTAKADKERTARTGSEALPTAKSDEGSEAENTDIGSQKAPRGYGGAGRAKSGTMVARRGAAGKPASVGGGGALAAPKAQGETKAESPTYPDDLSGAMASAVGADKEAKQTKKKTASTGPDPSTIPERPSQGAVQGALASVRGAARACVAGMSAASRATVTFGSSGRVSSVSVSGPAAGTSAAGCIKAALRRANVGPFKRSSYTVGLTLRP